MFISLPVPNSILSLTLAALATSVTCRNVCEADIRPGAYSGYYSCTNQPRKATDFVKWNFFRDGWWTNILMDGSVDQQSKPTTTSDQCRQYDTESLVPVDLIRAGSDAECEFVHTTFTMCRNNSFVASTTCEAEGFSEVTCSGTLTYTPFKEDISLSNSYGKYRSRCYRIRRPLRIQYGFEDTGGFYALFKLSAQSCGGSKSKQLVNFARYTSSASLYGKVTLPPGRYSFVGSSTDQWWIEGVPGVR